MESDNYRTPPYVVSEIEKHFELRFNFDPCPFKSTFDGLNPNVRWSAFNWVNPPYNAKDKPKFVNRAVSEAVQLGNVSVLLLPANTDSYLFHEVICKHTEVYFLHGRIRFLNENWETTGTGRHTSMFCYVSRATIGRGKLVGSIHLNPANPIDLNPYVYPGITL